MNNIIRNRSLSDIVESGSNANGSFVKYRNGVMEQWGTVTGTHSSSTNNTFGSSAGTLYYFYTTITFPQAFQDTTYNIIGTGTNNSEVAELFSLVTTTNVRVLSMAAASGSTANVKWRAIGKWTSVYDSSKPTISIGRGIIESASNANGSYIKYEDGTMECWISNVGLAPTSINTGTSTVWTFPAPFVSPPAVSQCTAGTSSGNVSDTGNAVRNGIYLSTLTNSSVYLAMHAYQVATSTTVYFNMRAVGRWQSATNMVGDYTYGQGIVETGSNSNGNWIKFDDGTMIQWGKFTRVLALVVTAYLHTIGTGVSSFTLPTSFFNTSYITNMQVHLSIAGNLVGYIGTESASVNVVNWREQWPYDYGVAGRTYEWYAVGKWK